jgi:hypothetical protein
MILRVFPNQGVPPVNKLSLLALASLLTLGVGVSTSAMPATAATIAECRDDTSNSRVPGDGDTSQIGDFSSNIMQALHAKGVNATDISDWGGCVRADVVKPNGQTALEFFDPDTLQRLHRG